MEAAAALRAMVDRLPNLELASEPSWRPLFNIRGLVSLDLTV
jgi:cytochrome P450